MISLFVLTLTLVIACSHADFSSKYKIDKREISVSGFSAGATMATQMHVIYSKTFIGVATFAGTPYHCANGDVDQAQDCRNIPGYIDVPSLTTATDDFAALNRIDSTKYLKRDRVYIFNGANDSMVRPGALLKVEEFYSHYVKKPSNIYTELWPDAEHGFPTVAAFGSACELLPEYSFLINCFFDAAYAALNFIHGGQLQQPLPRATALGQLIPFDQSEFLPPAVTLQDAAMDEKGFLYVPPGCQGTMQSCKLHVVFHGCKQSRGMVDEQFVRGAGYNQVADLNDFIILYPQALNTTENGCFDWWAFTNADYDTNSGLQTSTVKRMIDSLLA